MGQDNKPYIVVIIIQVLYTGLFIVSKAALNAGLGPLVFLFYRQAIASFILVPLALLVKRGSSESRLSFMTLLKIFMVALIATVSLDVYHLGLKYTSETVASAMYNSIPVETFFLAFLLGMETLNLRKFPGIAKATGLLLCLARVVAMAFYVGPAIHPLNHHRLFLHNGSSHVHVHSKASWIKGTFLLLCSFTTWSLWLVMQGLLMKECPSKLLLTTIQCVFSMLQSLVVTLAFERDFSKWKIAIDSRLLGIVYAGVCIAGISWYLQAWCIEKKGPVFVAMSNPLSLIFTIFCALFFLGETIHLGSVLGGILMIAGLYRVLWGKNKESNLNTRGAGQTQYVILPIEENIEISIKS